jgi:pyruvate,water dikinase
MVNIVSLHNLKEDAKPIVGERVMFLSKIARSVNIPLGFVVTSNVYKAFIESNDLYKKIDSLLKVIEINDLDMLQHIANEIQKLIISTHLPKAIADEIIESYESLNIDAGSKVNLDHMVVHSDEPSVYINPSPLTETAYGAHHGFPNIKGKNKVLDIIVTC